MPTLSEMEHVAWCVRDAAEGKVRGSNPDKVQHNIGQMCRALCENGYVEEWQTFWRGSIVKVQCRLTNRETYSEEFVTENISFRGAIGECGDRYPEIRELQIKVTIPVNTSTPNVQNLKKVNLNDPNCRSCDHCYVALPAAHSGPCPSCGRSQ